MPFKAYYLDPAGKLHGDLNEQEVQTAYASREGLLWVDISETTEEDGRFLSRVFQFHPLTIEDCIETTINTSKVDEFDDYLFMMFHGINYSSESNILQTTELDVFLGSNYEPVPKLLNPLREVQRRFLR